MARPFAASYETLGATLFWNTRAMTAAQLRVGRVATTRLTSRCLSSAAQSTCSTATMEFRSITASALGPPTAFFITLPTTPRRGFDDNGGTLFLARRITRTPAGSAVGRHRQQHRSAVSPGISTNAITQTFGSQGTVLVRWGARASVTRACCSHSLSF
jgi:hypothetical protein